jgi:DNA repair ATPase RecN
MLRLRHIIMRGPGVEDATVSFVAGANILAGESDTGKSLLLHCLDYILGADEMRKRVPETEAYAQLFVEFANTRQEILTLAACRTQLAINCDFRRL